MSKLQLTDSPMDMMMKMSDGNPGAITTLVDLYAQTKQIDPQNFLEEIGPMFALDDMGIYGSDIYILWSDKCSRNTRRLVMWLRAVQLGLFSRAKMQEMSKDQMRRICLSEEDFVDLDRQVCEQLKDFN